jgi:hypothetical protein
MIGRTLGFVATCVAVREERGLLGFLRTAIMPDVRVIRISAGNPND